MTTAPDISPDLIPKSTTEDRRGKRVLEIREILWGDTLLDVTQHARGARVLFGEARDADHFLPTDTLPWDPFPMIRPDSDGPVLNLTFDMEGYIERQGRRIAIAELRAGFQSSPSDLSTPDCPVYEVPLEPDDQVLITLGPMALLVRQVSRARPVAQSLMRAVNWGFAAILLGSLAGIGGLLGTAALTGQGVERVAPLDRDDRFVKTFMPLAVPEQEPARPDDKPAPVVARPAEPPPGEAGKLGDPDSDVALARGTPKKAFSDEQVASDAGILGLLGRSDMREVAELFADGGGNMGHLDDDLGLLDRGPQDLDMGGLGGLALRGKDGLGGGGRGLTIGALGTWGKGNRNGIKGYNPGRMGEARHRLKVPEGPAFTGEVRGSLARAVIDRVLKRYYSQLRYCYQKELVTKPHLDGKIKVEFIIAEDGRVKEAYIIDRATTLRDDKVQDCACRVIQRIKFPRPKHGIVVVRYPLVFASTG